MHTMKYAHIFAGKKCKELLYSIFGKSGSFVFVQYVETFNDSLEKPGPSLFK